MQQDDQDFRVLADLTAPKLTTAEQFVLGVCRCWDAFMEDPDPYLAWRELAPVFRYMNVLGALCAFDRTFKALRAHRLRRLNFQDTDSVRVGLDEARILGGLASLQRGMPQTSVRLLKDTVSAAGLRAVLPPLARIASILDGRGHRLPLWQMPPLLAL
jgi:hypothetical protein